MRFPKLPDLRPSTFRPSTSPQGYYGLPILKRAHWGWEIILYFWVGGTAAGAYLVAALADLCGDERDRATVRAGRLIALPLMVLSPVLLIKDLGRPRKFLHMLRVVKLKSPMSVGSWGLTIFGGFAGLSALLEIVDRAEHRRPLRRGVAALGAPFALLVGGYGGVLLSATAIPLWARGRFLWGPVFLASAFSTGGATIEAALALGGDRRALDRLGRAHLLPLAAEAALLVAGLARLGPAVAPLTKGRWRSLFLPGVFGLGLALPLAQGLRKSLGPGRDAGHGRVESVLSTFAILLGGLILRACVVYAGRDSADDAATYFALTGSVDERA